MRLAVFFIVPIIIVLGCSTSTKDLSLGGAQIAPGKLRIPSDRAPNEINKFLERAAQRTDHPGTRWWALYKRAQLLERHQPQISCQLYSQLLKEPYFPIKDVTLYKAYEICPRTHPLLISAQDSFPKIPKHSWLNSMHLHAQENVAHITNNKKLLQEIFLRKSKSSRVQKEKVILTQKALAIAKQRNDQRAIRSLNHRIIRLSPRLNPAPKPKQYLSVAYDYRRARDFTKAKHYYRSYLKTRRLALPKKLKALRGLRATHKIENNIPLMIKTSESMATLARKNYYKSGRTKKSAKTYAENLTLLARTYWTKGFTRKAEKTLRGLANQIKRHPTHLPKIYWLLGRIQEEKNQYRKAINWYRKSMMYSIKNTGLKHDVIWSLAWNLKRTHQHHQAIEVFQKLIKMIDEKREPHFFAKIQFWLAKALSESEQQAKANKIYNKLMKENSLGYYGLLSHRETHNKIQLPTPQRAPASIPNDSISNLVDWYDPVYFEWIVAVGEDQVSLYYLRKLSKAIRRSKGKSTQSFLALLGLYSKAGHNLSLLGQMASLPQKIKEEIYSSHPSLLFPQPYKSQVTEAAKKFQIHPELIYAIMRQESAFNPKARSPMDAFGLMQILPKVAKATANQTGLSFNQVTDLYEPKINISIGSALLNELSQKNKGQFIRMVASYNAAESAIHGWFRTRYRGNTEEFVEDIPYEETRNYIKLVLRNLVYYKLIASPERKIAFPDWCLKLSASI